MESKKSDFGLAPDARNVAIASGSEVSRGSGCESGCEVLTPLAILSWLRDEGQISDRQFQAAKAAVRR